MNGKGKCILCCFNMLVCCGCRNQLLERNAFFPPECSYLFLPSGSNNSNSGEDKSQIQQGSQKQQKQTFASSPTSLFATSKLPSMNITSSFQHQQQQFQQYDFYYKLDEEPYQQQLPPVKDLSITGYKINAHYRESPNASNLPSAFIPVLVIKYTNANDHRNQVILHSHANSTDLGLMLDSYLDLAFNLRADVIAYDYSGYGIARGNTLNDIEMFHNILSVYKFMTEELRYPWYQIILYGQSVGSGPSTLVASLRDMPVSGLVLHSAISSGLQTALRGFETDEAALFRSSVNLHRQDFFPNYKLIKYVNCPVFIVHGDQDQIAPIHHVNLLAANVKPTTLLMKWIAKDGGHNNLESEDKFRNEYFYLLREFLSRISAYTFDKPIKDVYNAFRANTWDLSLDHIYTTEIHEIISKINEFDSKINHTRMPFQSVAAEIGMVDTSNFEKTETVPENSISPSQGLVAPNTSVTRSKENQAGLITVKQGSSRQDDKGFKGGQSLQIKEDKKHHQQQQHISNSFQIDTADVNIRDLSQDLL